MHMAHDGGWAEKGSISCLHESFLCLFNFVVLKSKLIQILCENKEVCV